jgi:hypothetical protein
MADDHSGKLLRQVNFIRAAMNSIIVYVKFAMNKNP